MAAFPDISVVLVVIQANVSLPCLKSHQRTKCRELWVCVIIMNDAMPMPLSLHLLVIITHDIYACLYFHQ